MKKAKKYVTALEAAEILGVQPHTVRDWARRGRLKGARIRTNETGKRSYVSIPQSALKDAFLAICSICGREFRACRPVNAQYCSPRHRWIGQHLRRRTSKKPYKPHKSTSPD